MLADPRLLVFDGSGTIIAKNEDWSGDPMLRATLLQAGTFAPPGDSKDAARLPLLQPGSYSVVLASGIGGDGEGLIEVFEVP